MATKLETAADLGIPLKITVARSPVVNAVALPGGVIYLFRGLIAKSENADEVADETYSAPLDIVARWPYYASKAYQEMAALESGIPKLCEQVAREGGLDAARAIMTTDTMPKESVATVGATQRDQSCIGIEVVWSGVGDDDIGHIAGTRTLRQIFRY